MDYIALVFFIWSLWSPKSFGSWLATIALAYRDAMGGRDE